MQNGYIRSLDGLRAIAILLVMTFHAELTRFGWMGVQLFFVLSGFLITGILWREKTRPDTAGNKLKKFWLRRSLRIFPLYFGYLAILGLIYLVRHFPSYYTTYIPWLATYTFNYTRTLPQWQGNPLFTHLWSLSIEEQFYLFFPLLVFFAPRKWIPRLMIAIVFVAPLIRWLLGRWYVQQGFSEPVVADVVYWNTLSHLDAFFMGGLIPILHLDQRIKRPVRLFIIALLIAIAAGAFNYVKDGVAAFPLDLGYDHGHTANYEHVWQYTVLNLLFASFILSLVSEHAGRAFAPVRRLFEQNWMVRIGRVSYGMYLFHWAILVYVFNRFTAHPGIRFLVFIFYAIAVYAFAELSYRFYEVRFLKLKERLSKEKNGSA